MANLAKTTEFTINGPKKETPLEKTTRIVRKINDEDAEIRNDKMAQLRKDRFESEAVAPVEVIAEPSSET
ncbi:MAG: hypothetical protein ACI9ND_002640 [Yoonia sp.]|jgi:hypothetical protein